MEKLIFGTGLKRYEVNDNGAIFSFNPTDINLYARFIKMRDAVLKIGAEVEKKAEEINESEEKSVEALASTMEDADRRVKQELTECFGKSNDFELIFDGSNVFSPTLSGNWLITEFITAITPIIEKRLLLSQRKERREKHLKSNRTRQRGKANDLGVAVNN